MAPFLWTPGGHPSPDGFVSGKKGRKGKSESLSCISDFLIYLELKIFNKPRVPYLGSCCWSVSKSCPTLWDPHGLQQARLLCPPLSPRVCLNSCSLSWWCYLTISSSAILFSFCLQSFPAAAKSLQSCLTLCDPIDGSPQGSPVPGILQARTLEWVAISIFPSISLFQWVRSLHQVAKVLNLQHQSSQWNIQGWFPFGLTYLISLQSKGLSRVFSSNTIQKHQSLDAQPSLWSKSYIHTWLPERPYMDLWLYGPLGIVCPEPSLSRKPHAVISKKSQVITRKDAHILTRKTQAYSLLFFFSSLWT